MWNTQRNPVSSIIATNNSATVLYVPKDNYLYAIGKNPDRMFSLSSSSYSSENSFRPKESKLTQVSISNTFCLQLCNEQKVFGCPGAKREYYGSWVEGSDDEFNLIKLPEEIGAVHKILALSSCSIFLVTSKISNKKELYSFGLKDFPGVGQGTHPLKDDYGRLDYDDAIEFKDLVGCDNMAAAITIKGELYTWGKGNKNSLGLPNPEGGVLEQVNKPTKVPGLEKYEALQVSVSQTNMVVLLADREHPEMKRVFAYGDNSKGQLGVKDENVSKAEISFFDNKKPYRVCAGQNCIFVSCGDVKKGITFGNAVCAKHNKEKIISGHLYLNKTKTEGMKYYCKDCATEGSLPQVCMAIRNPINSMEQKPWPNLEQVQLVAPAASVEVSCSQCKALIKSGAYFKSAIKETDSILCVSCFTKTPISFLPVIYYRIADVTKAVANAAEALPVLSLSSFFDTIPDSLSVTLEPKYSFQFPPAILEAKVKPTYEEFMADFKEFETQHDMDILDLLNDHMIEKDIKIESMKLKNEYPLSFGKKQGLSKISEEKLKRRSKALIKFNKVIRKAIDFIDFNTKSEGADDLYLGYTKVKDYILLKTKDSIMKQVLTDGPRVRGKQECVLERHKAFLLKQSGQCDHTGTKSLFGQLYKILKDKVDQFKKKPKSGKFPFKVKFKSEGGVDAGGLFRETLDHVSGELQSQCLPLLIPTPNNKTSMGEEREKWTINPSSTQPMHLQLYEFFGNILGMSIRLMHLLPLNLPSSFWKQVIEEPVDISDLKLIDAYCVQCLEVILFQNI